jgi:hypothetical protein
MGGSAAGAASIEAEPREIDRLVFLARPLPNVRWCDDRCLSAWCAMRPVAPLSNPHQNGAFDQEPVSGPKTFFDRASASRYRDGESSENMRHE